MENVLLFFSLKYQGNWQLIYRALEQKEKVPVQPLKQVKQEINQPYVTIISDDYPSALKNIAEPPFVFYYLGDETFLRSYYRTIALISNPSSTNQTLKIANRFLNQLAKENRIILISDQGDFNHYLLEKLLTNKMDFIMVTQRGLNNFVVEEKTLLDKLANRQHYLIVSEFHDTPSQINKPIENHLKYGLPKALIFFETSAGSEEMALYTFGHQEGRYNFVLPTPLTAKQNINNGNNYLIKKGARLIETPQEVLESI